ncbi:hypothetical protein Tco_1241011 [Tanacetum coccineum]
MQGEDLSEEDFVKRMVDMVNQRKKYFAEERAKAKRSKPMTQTKLRTYMSNYLKNQVTWKLSQLKKLTFEEIKEKFDKLVKHIDTFVPMGSAESQEKVATKNIVVTEEKDGETTVPKEEEEVEKSTKIKSRRLKTKARKGLNIDRDAQEDSETDGEEDMEAIGAIPVATKSPSVVSWKIFQQGQRSIYQIIRANGADIIYMSFGAMLKDITRDDLTELYRLVMQKYEANRPEDVYDRVLWSDLRTMFESPLSEDAIWSLPLQQKMLNWRYYDSRGVHYLTLEAAVIYILTERKYPLSSYACQAMLDMKLQGGKHNEECYQLLKLIEKQSKKTLP